MEAGTYYAVIDGPYTVARSFVFTAYGDHSTDLAIADISQKEIDEMRRRAIIASTKKKGKRCDYGKFEAPDILRYEWKGATWFTYYYKNESKTNILTETLTFVELNNCEIEGHEHAGKEKIEIVLKPGEERLFLGKPLEVCLNDICMKMYI
jgi:hypothetical protein